MISKINEYGGRIIQVSRHIFLIGCTGVEQDVQSNVSNSVIIRRISRHDARNHNNILQKFLKRYFDIDFIVYVPSLTKKAMVKIS